jgi:hypothetical protein
VRESTPQLGLNEHDTQQRRQAGQLRWREGSWTSKTTAFPADPPAGRGDAGTPTPTLCRLAVSGPRYSRRSESAHSFIFPRFPDTGRTGRSQCPLVVPLASRFPTSAWRFCCWWCWSTLTTCTCRASPANSVFWLLMTDTATIGPIPPLSKCAAYSLSAATGFAVASALGITHCSEGLVAAGMPLGSNGILKADACSRVTSVTPGSGSLPHCRGRTAEAPCRSPSAGAP